MRDLHHFWFAQEIRHKHVNRYMEQYRVFLPVRSGFISSLKKYLCHVDQLSNLVTRSYVTECYSQNLSSLRKVSLFLCVFKVGSIFYTYSSDLFKIVHEKLVLYFLDETT